MDIFIEPIGRLINEFSKLPGVGKKTAQRYAYRIINMSESDARAFADAIVNVKRKVRYCKVCGNLKIDTHRDNRIMQHLLDKNGFTYCGIIYLDDGTERLAYQKQLG